MKTITNLKKKKMATNIMIQNFTLDWSNSEEASEINPARDSRANPVKYMMRLNC